MKAALFLAFSIQTGFCHFLYGLNFKYDNGTATEPYETSNVWLLQPFLGWEWAQKSNLYSFSSEFNWNWFGGLQGLDEDTTGNSKGISLHANYYRLLIEKGDYGLYLGPSATFNYVRTEWRDMPILIWSTDTNRAEAVDDVVNAWLQANVMSRIKLFYLQFGYGYRMGLDKRRRYTLVTNGYPLPKFEIAGNSKFEVRFILSLGLIRRNDEKRSRGNPQRLQGRND